MNVVLSDSIESIDTSDALKKAQLNNLDKIKPINEQLVIQNEEATIDPKEKYFLPFSGNGYIGISASSKIGILASFQKYLSLPINYNPLVQIYSDTFLKKG